MLVRMYFLLLNTGLIRQSGRVLYRLGFRMKTGHYSAMVWAHTNKVGCGVTTYNHGGRIGRLYVCNYGPAGNIPGAAMYQIGNSCTRCPKYSQCSYSYPGLCI